MPMPASQARSLYGRRGYRPQSVLNRALGDIKLSASRAEGQGVAFNRFPEIAERLPVALGQIVYDTTEAVAARADQRVPVGREEKPNHKPGTLKASQRIIYYHSRQTGQIVTGRIDYMAVDPDGSRHFYGFYVEVGTSRTAAQPFLLPSLIEERQPFNERCRNLEKLIDIL